MRIDTGIVWTIGNIERKIIVERHNAIYHYKHTVTRVWAEPTTKGKNAPAYIETKRQLGDDWATDLTDSWFGVEYPHHMVEAIDRIINGWEHDRYTTEDMHNMEQTVKNYNVR